MSNNVPLTVQEIAEIAARLAAATPGPWKQCMGADGTGCVCGGVWSVPADFPIASTDTDSPEEGVTSTPERKHADATFIAHAPTDMARLLAELQRAHDERDALAGQLAAAERLVVELLTFLPADDIEGATLEWYAAKFELKLGHPLFGQRLRLYAVAVREYLAGQQENFFDAVRRDPDMTPAQKERWLALESSRAALAGADTKEREP